MFYGGTNTIKVNKMILSQLEMDILEEYRIDTKYPKYMLINLLNYKNTILKSLGQVEEPQECFCEVPRRREFHNEFFLFYDKYKSGYEF